MQHKVSNKPCQTELLLEKELGSYKCNLNDSAALVLNGVINYGQEIIGCFDY